MSVKLLTEQHLKFLRLKGAAQAGLSLHLSKYHIVGNHMSWLNYKGGGEGVRLFIFLEVIDEFYRESYRPPTRSNWTPFRGRGSVPVFLREPIATCGFLDGGGGHPALRSESVHYGCFHAIVNNKPAAFEILVLNATYKISEA